MYLFVLGQCLHYMIASLHAVVRLHEKQGGGAYVRGVHTIITMDLLGFTHKAKSEI